MQRQGLNMENFNSSLSSTKICRHYKPYNNTFSTFVRSRKIWIGWWIYDICGKDLLKMINFALQSNNFSFLIIKLSFKIWTRKLILIKIIHFCCAFKRYAMLISVIVEQMAVRHAHLFQNQKMGVIAVRWVPR